ncbi:BREX-1 system adenine-specific DNA-methyltransferase PglX [Georgenia sp. TF02-10]|uniref:BREX-1 system adenine-specific DNA-methyltransferase PglX n=1 Tax=Georgenia sp. TF02-10 TaxID=2917725 RepID=UPI001FA7121A|nr:BREX-1 system adenine-specific DNA-methyltransferase PglX [Georgenia sp. TF02-10]UNX56061.1 BREX-1 system adenine-specific DNA-methyltransferase PglX [Georgenia sp. TF02-10]
MTTATNTVLNSDQRRFLDTQTQRAREAAQRAAEDALRALAVSEPSRPGYLSDEQNKLRLELRDKARQLGDDTARAGALLTNLIHDVAYEQWHRLLFARFLEVNGLLRHPEYRDIPLSLEDCGDLASDLDEPDAWAVAARFASEILPGVFRLNDPAVQVRFAAEHRNALERLLLEIPAEVFTTEDALGWVYQFWQTAEKKRVNDSGVKIGGADLSPVTQLFTENYMVRFLLESSLGAWWAACHPDSPLIDGWEYLRRLDDGTPAAGAFDEWPATAAEVTVVDPCCGSGHFLVAMFGMLWRMRAEEEGLTPADAQDAVLRENLHGLELDPRCTQIATFNVALEAWKQGGFRDLPAPQIACSGIPVRGGRAEWEDLAGEDAELRKAMARLHTLFRNADTLGSLIDPRAGVEGMALFGTDMAISVSEDQLRELLASALAFESGERTVLGLTAGDVVEAARLLAREFTLAVTNPPWLGKGREDDGLAAYVKLHHADASGDLAITFLDRLERSARSVACVLPQSLTSQSGMRSLRVRLLERCRIRLVARLGDGAFPGISGQVVQPILLVTAPGSREFATLDTLLHRSAADKAYALRTAKLGRVAAIDALASRGQRISFSESESSLTIGEIAEFSMGVQTGDNERFTRKFWEVASGSNPSGWENYLRSPEATGATTGRSTVLKWDDGAGAFMQFLVDRLGEKGVRSWLRGQSFWGKQGVLVSRVGANPVTRYEGEIYADNSVGFIPRDPAHLGALWALFSDPSLSEWIDEIDSGPSVTGGTIAAVRVDKDAWDKLVVSTPAPAALGDVRTTAPYQWLFKGEIPISDHPLQVAVARLLGYRWPDQPADGLDLFADSDGIASLQSLPAEPDLATRLRELFAVAYGEEWSSATERRLVVGAGGKNGRLEDWLRDSFFAQHVKVFDRRPFLWHVWDGRKDGFSAIVNYHKLNRRTLEKLAFTSLGAWIDRQKHEARAERAGADARLAAAEELQRRLKLILEGAPPYDIYVRWKQMAQQPIGWEPDVDDGVRLNIRPFVTAGVLRSKVGLHWRKDPGTNPDRSERHNDLHPTLEERRAARREAEAAG